MNEYTGGRYVQDVEILVILRVLIRLSEDLSKDCNTSTSQVVESVCGYLETAYHVLHNLWSQPEPSSLALSTGRTASLKELEWFAQTAWNFGLQSCEVWKDDTLTNRFLGIAFKLLDLIMPETMDTIHRKKLCLFISIASRMLENCDRDPKIIHIVLEDIKKLKRLKSVATSLSVSVTTDSIVSDPTDGLVLLFEFEANVRLKQYENAVQTIQVADSFKQLSLHIFERMADILLKEPDCPSTVTFIMLQFVLEAILSREKIDFVRYARWMRILVTAALVRNKPAALPYFAQVIAYLKDMAKDQYPQDEIRYLMVVAWNEGIDYFQGSDLASARVWCEVALSFLQHIHGNKALECEMRETFRKICATKIPFDD
ncbi:hypothetical protein BC936DRAFT_148354 [Jimgerdemannia flammicorona]|uniref:Protein ZIP4 homolog n=1 Tax=Jimgerdemannia flammicorona TaxID=994334 RepID=A0A433DNJ5_9FUNG|nr:hypothetical protein BC936DRAFT_148354 [Jimgerdemannia flammicorona]